MKVAVFSTKPYDREFFTSVNEQFGHGLVFLEPRLTWQTSPLPVGFPAVCAFVNERAHHGPPGILHPQRPDGDRQRNAGQRHCLREGRSPTGPDHGGSGAVSS